MTRWEQRCLDKRVEWRASQVKAPKPSPKQNMTMTQKSGLKPTGLHQCMLILKPEESPARPAARRLHNAPSPFLIPLPPPHFSYAPPRPSPTEPPTTQNSSRKLLHNPDNRPPWDNPDLLRRVTQRRGPYRVSVGPNTLRSPLCLLSYCSFNEPHERVSKTRSWRHCSSCRRSLNSFYVTAFLCLLLYACFCTSAFICLLLYFCFYVSFYMPAIICLFLWLLLHAGYACLGLK